MHRTHHIIIDSKFRRFSKYPNSWHYSVPLPEPLRNVVSMDLIRAFMPNTQETVHRFNNHFQMLLSSGQIVDVTLDTGNYEPALLLSAIQGNLVSAGVQNPVLSLAPDTNLVSITADEPFSLLFGSGNLADTSIHRYLGFSNIDTASATEATGFYPMALPPPAFVTVSVAEIPRGGCKRVYKMQQESPPVYSGIPELNEQLYVGLIPLDCDYQTFKFHLTTTTEVLGLQFQPTDIRSLTIDIKDDMCKPYDADNYDHALVFQVTTLEAPDLPLMCPGNNRLPGPSPWNVQCRFP